jgi:hypothetical protein
MKSDSQKFKEKYEASKIAKQLNKAKDVNLLVNSELLLIVASLRNSSSKIRRQIEYLGDTISTETKTKLYSDMYDISKLIEKIDKCI